MDHYGHLAEVRTAMLLMLLACTFAASALMADDRGIGRRPAPVEVLVAPDSSFPRRALVIGVDQYPFAPLENAVADARGMARVLRELGFSVEPLIDPDIAQMRAALRAHIDGLRRDGGTGVIYFAGHGLRVNGKNRLLAVDASIVDAGQAARGSLALADMLDGLAGADNRINLVVLDACRNDPFTAGAAPGLKAGLAEVGNTPPDLMVQFATQPGATASDGAGQTHSPFSAALIAQLKVPDQELGALFRVVRDRVFAATGNGQLPSEFGTLRRELILYPKARPQIDPQAVATDAPSALDLAVADLLAFYEAQPPLGRGLLLTTAIGVLIIIISMLLSLGAGLGGGDGDDADADALSADEGDEPVSASAPNDIKLVLFSPRSIGVFLSVFGSVGFVLLTEIALPPWQGLFVAAFAGLLVVQLFAWLRRGLIRLGGPVDGPSSAGLRQRQQIVGQLAEVILTIPDPARGGVGQVRLLHRPDLCSACHDGAGEIPPGTQVRILSEKGACVAVEPVAPV